MNQFDPVRTAEFFRLTREFPQYTNIQIANELGCEETSVRRMRRAVKEGRLVNDVAKPKSFAEGVAPELGARVAAESCELVTANPCTLDDLLVACKVDQTVWRVERHVINKWEVGARQESGEVTRTPLFQIKAWLERSVDLDLAKTLREVVEEIRVNSPVGQLVSTPAEIPTDDPHLLEVSLPDIHVGKLTWAPEVGENYDLKIAPALALKAAHNLWVKSKGFSIERILLPIGNDFLNVNNAASTTAGGTPQDEDGRWKRSFRVGCKLAVDLIEYFRGKTPGGVDVMIVPGNHDPERIYYMGCFLEAMYSQCKDVRVNNGERARKYFRYGSTLLGFTHGQGEKHDKLPLIMAGEEPKNWSETTHHEWHLGHLHHKRETQYHTGQEFGPVRVRILPSLCPADEWHYVSGYVGAKRAAEAYLWSFKNGYTGHLSYSAS